MCSIYLVGLEFRCLSPLAQSVLQVAESVTFCAITKNLGYSYFQIYFIQFFKNNLYGSFSNYTILVNIITTNPQIKKNHLQPKEINKFLVSSLSAS